MLRWPQIWPQWVSQICWTWKTDIFMEWKYLRYFTCWPRFHLQYKVGWQGSDQHFRAHSWSSFCYSFLPWDWRKKLQWWWWWWRSEWKLYGNWNFLVRPRKSFWIHPTQKETNSFLNQSANLGYLMLSFEWNRFFIFGWSDPKAYPRKIPWIAWRNLFGGVLLLWPSSSTTKCTHRLCCSQGKGQSVGHPSWWWLAWSIQMEMAEWCLWDRHWISSDEPWMGVERLWLYEHRWAVSYMTE